MKVKYGAGIKLLCNMFLTNNFYNMTRFFILFMIFMTVNVSATQFNGLSAGSCCFAQGADTLVGLIVNQKGKPMRNITVSYTRTMLQRTDRNGIFVFPNVSLNDTLSLFLPKKRIWQVPVAGMSFLKITVREDNYSLTEAKDEIVYIGYGTMNKRNTPSDVVSISGDELRRGGQTDLTRALTGKIAGLTVVRRDDGEMKLVIRGGSPSFMIEDNSALLVVDGMIVENFDHVDIFSVETVTVMKQATMYGMRGSNGAVIVKLK